MKPLGLQVTARPEGRLRDAGADHAGLRLPPARVTELSGERHGRSGAVRFGGHEDAGLSEVAIARPAATSSRRKSRRVEVASGPEGACVISRRKAAPGDWLCDLWLAERLASG